MKKNHKRALLVVLCLAVLVAVSALFRFGPEFALLEPQMEDVIRGGLPLQKVLNRASQSTDIQEQAELTLSGEELDSLLAVLQSKANPFWEKIPHNDHGLFFRLSRDGRHLKIESTYPLPGRLLFCSGVLSAEPQITPQEVVFHVAQAKFGAYPVPKSLAGSRLNARGAAFLQSDIGKLCRAAIVSLDVRENGDWFVIYRPFLMKKLLISQF